jgi:hypothetical protein
VEPELRPLVRPPPIRLGALEVDVLRRTARLGAATCRLSAPALRLLYVLAANADQVLTRAEIQEVLSGGRTPSRLSGAFVGVVEAAENRACADRTVPRTARRLGCL